MIAQHFLRSPPMPSRLAAALVLVALLAGCGTTPAERVSTGAMIGAAGGALAGAAIGMPLTGAALGAAAGTTVGALTVPSQVDLGKPVWKW
jgi:hypothetical protein